MPFNWELFKTLETFVKVLRFSRLELPISVALFLCRLRFTFTVIFVLAALNTDRLSEFIAYIFGNTIDLMLEFQDTIREQMNLEELQHATSPAHEYYWSQFTAAILQHAPHLELLLAPGVLYLSHAMFMRLVTQRRFGITQLGHLTGEAFWFFLALFLGFLPTTFLAPFLMPP